MIIPVAHDFICPWCWVGLFQAQELAREFDVQFEWRAYELLPYELEWPPHKPSSLRVATDRPKTPTRMELALAAQRLELPQVQEPYEMRTHRIHNAVEFAKTEGPVDAWLEVLYRAYWEDGIAIDEPEQIYTLAEGFVRDRDEMMKAVNERRFKDKIIGFDRDAYASGIYNVPTFIIGEDRYAEQPITVLRNAVRLEMEK